MSNRFRVVMAGGAYIFTYVEPSGGQSGGWRVVKVGSPELRLGGSYFVRVTEKGLPKSCNCASATAGGRYCKHMQAVLDWACLQQSPPVEV